MVYSLHQDFDKNYSYPELVELMFGEKKWNECVQRYGLRGQGMTSFVEGTKKSKGFTGSYTESLKAQLEYMYNEIMES